MKSPDFKLYTATKRVSHGRTFKAVRNENYPIFQIEVAAYVTTHARKKKVNDPFSFYVSTYT